MVTRTIISIIFLLSCTILQAQDVFNDYTMQPEVWHFTGYPKGKVDNKGDLNLSLPVLTVPGRNGLDYTVNFNYHAPILRDQRASWIGLGWEFDPGSITCDVQGGIENVRGADFAEPNFDLWVQPDMYYLTLPDEGTAEFSRSNRPEFYQNYLNGQSPAFEPLNDPPFYFHLWKPWKIEPTIGTQADFQAIWGSNLYPHKHTLEPVPEYLRFVITRDDGLRYIFEMPTLSWHRAQYYGTPSTHHDQYVSAWRLAAILSPECPPYTGVLPDENTSGNWIRLDYRFEAGQPFHFLVVDGRPIHNTYLWKISTPTHHAIFETTNRNDVDFKTGEEYSHKKLTAIHLYQNDSPEPVKSVALFQSNQLCYNGNNGKTTLDSLTFWGQNGESEPGYIFYYNPFNPAFQTMWLTDGNKNNDDFGYYDTGSYTDNFDLNKDDGKAWSLSKIVYPTGGSAEFEYENDELFGGFENRNTISIPYPYFSGIIPENVVVTKYYSYTSKLHQGGSRVKKIIRNDANGHSFEETYTYGNGFPTGIPPLNYYNLPYYAYYMPGKRGKLAVIYEWVRSINPDGKWTKKYYTIPAVQTSAGEALPVLNAIEQISMIYVYQFQSGTGQVIGNEDGLWGHNYKTETEVNGHSVKSEKEYSLFQENLSSSYSAPIGAHDFHVKWIYLPVNAELTLENGLHKRTEYEFENGPRLVSKVTETGSLDDRKMTETIYAHQIDEYGGPAVQNSPRDKNMLNQAAQTISSYQDSYGTIIHHNSEVTKWKYYSIGESSFWKEFQIYHWLSETPQTQKPLFSDWLPGSVPVSQWQRHKTLEQYNNFGLPIRIVDANDNLTELFYGFNNDNFNNYNDGFNHAYLTGIIRDNLHMAINYDALTGNVISIEDPNNQTFEFYYDYLGRLAGEINADDELIRAYSYYFSRDETGEKKNYLESLTFSNGNLIKNNSFEIANNSVTALWPTSQGSSVMKKQMNAVLGSQYINISPEGYIGSHSFNLEADKHYIISAWFKKTTSNPANARILIKQLVDCEILAHGPGSSAGFDAAGNGVYVEKNISTTDWERVWLKIRSNVSQTLNLEISCNGVSGISADDVILCPLFSDQASSVYPLGVEPLVRTGYYDGLSQKIQSIESGGPYRLGSQIIHHWDLDSEGKEIKKWKPYPSVKSDAYSVLTSYENRVDAEGDPRSAFAYYDGSSGPDAGGYPYQRNYYGIDQNYFPFRFPEGELYQIPENQHPVDIPIEPVQNRYAYLINAKTINSEHDHLSYPDQTLRKIINIDENRIPALVYFNKFNEKIVSCDAGYGPVFVNFQAYAVPYQNPEDYERFHFTAITSEILDVSWKATFSNVEGASASIKVGTYPDGGDLLSVQKNEDYESNYPIPVTEGNTYYFTLYSNSGFTENISAPESADKNRVKTDGTETDKYASSYCSFDVEHFDIYDVNPNIKTEYEYDGAGNLVTVKPPNYHNPPTGSNPADWIITQEYNSLNQLTGRSTPDDGTTQYLYDAYGNVRFSQDANQTDAGKVLFTTYDFANRPLKSGIAATSFNQLSGAGSYSFETVEENWVAVNHYDNLPDPSEYPWNRIGSLSQYLGYLENLQGKLAASAFKSGDALLPYDRTLPVLIISTALDFQARHYLNTGGEFRIEAGASVHLQSGEQIRLLPGFQASGGSQFRASIDPALLSQTDPLPVWQFILYNYDANGRISDKYVFTEDREIARHRYGYDSESRILQTMTQFGSQIFYQFYAYNNLGQLVRVYSSESDLKPDLCDVAYAYNPTGTISNISFNETAPGVFMDAYAYQYQIRDWLEQIGEPGNQNKPFFASYQHDYGGNILTAGYFSRESSLDNEYKYDFGYDNLYRLKYADYCFYSSGWNNHTRFDLSDVSYDPNGNILHLERAKEDGSLIDDIEYNYSGSNRLNGIVDAVSQSTESWDAEDCSYLYDANGNLTKIVSGGTAVIDTITYNHMNLPLRIVNGDGSEIFYRYNKEGQRIYKEVDENMPEYYIMDGVRTAAIASLGAGIKYWNIFALELAGKMLNTGDKYYYIKDHLGSIRAILNEANQVVESHDYYPFGLDMPSRSYISPQITERNKELFTGKERDGETGWDYFGARYYDPALGRWLSVDPLAEKYPSYSPYTYCTNNPLNYFDPDGKATFGVQIRFGNKSILLSVEINSNRVGFSAYNFTESAPQISPETGTEFGQGAKLAPGLFNLEPRESNGKIIPKGYPVYTTPGEKTGDVLVSNSKAENEVRGESTGTGAIGPHIGTVSEGCPLLDGSTEEKREESKKKREELKNMIEYNQNRGGNWIYILDIPLLKPNSEDEKQ